MINNNIAILIPVYNGLNYLKKSLIPIIEQIRKIETYNFKVIVIDDNSSDGTASWLAHNYPDVLVLNGSGNLWWSGGINMGVKYAQLNSAFGYVLLWNHDILCADDYFQALTSKIPEYDANTIIASKIYFLQRPDTIFNMGAFFNPLTGARILYGYNRTDSEEFSVPHYVDWTGGMGTLIPVEIFQEVGLFDERNFAQYYGDADFFLRAGKEGYKIVVLPDLKIWNDKSSSGITHNAKWHLFFRSLYSKKSNFNMIVEYKFLKRHCKSFLFVFSMFIGFTRYFGSFLKIWIKNLFK